MTQVFCRKCHSELSATSEVLAAMQIRLTPRQKQALFFINSELRSKRTAPRNRDIGEALSISSTSSVFKLLSHLEGKGYIVRGKGARSIALTKLGKREVRRP